MSSISLFPHPICAYMETYAALKMALPFTVCICALIAYASLDSYLPDKTHYGDIEYATTKKKLAELMARMNRGDFAVLGFSAGLHFLNAIAYAVTLTSACAFTALKLRDVYPKFARLGDIFAWLQLFEMSFYFIQHSCIISAFITEEPKDDLPQLTTAMSIMFLCILVPSVLYSLAGLFLVFRHGRKVNG